MMMTMIIDDDDDCSDDDHGNDEYEYDDDVDNDIQVSCVFITRKPLMRYLFRISS